MKKTISFLRSMKFGLLLLLPVLVLSVIGSIVPQGEAEELYAENFPASYHLILGLGLDHIFASAVFLLVCALFGLNLTLCSVAQFHAVPVRIEMLKKAAVAADVTQLSGAQASRLSEHLHKKLWRSEQIEGKTVFTSPLPGWYGSVITHFAILGILLAAVGIFGLTSSVDYSILPGKNAMPDGSTIDLFEFHASDESGRIDYASTLEITDASGRSSGVRTIRVNSPLRFGSRKYYQQTYGAAGMLSVTVRETGENYPLYMTEQGMISLGGSDGIWYDSVYPDYLLDSDGNFRVVTQTAGEYINPVYYVLVLQDGAMQPMILFPGEEVELSDAVYRFESPVEYPGIRVKTTPVWVYVLLYISFAAISP